MLQKLRVTVFLMIFCLVSTASGFAASNDGLRVEFDGKKIELPAKVMDGDLYIPLRGAGEAAGFTVLWSGSDGRIALSKGGMTVEFRLKENKIVADGQEVYLSGEYQLIGNTSYARTDFYQDYLGLDVKWDKSAGKVTLKTAKENPIVIRTAKEASETDTFKLTLQYPQVEGLGDAEVQKQLNDNFKKLALAAREQGLQNEKEYGADAATRHIKIETYFNYKVKYNRNGVLSLVFFNYQYSGGAHGLEVQSSMTVDLKTGAEYKLKDLFTDKTDYVSLVSAEVKKQMQAQEMYLLVPFDAIKADQDFYITSNGLVVYFQEYEYTPYAYGIPEFTVDFSTIGDMLAPGFGFLDTIPMDFEPVDNDQKIKTESKMQVAQTVKSIDTDKGRAFIYKKGDDPENLHGGFANAGAIYDLGAIGDIRSVEDLTGIKCLSLYGRTVLKFQGTYGSHVLETQYFTVDDSGPRPFFHTDGVTTELDIDRDGTDEIVAELSGALGRADVIEWNGIGLMAASVDQALDVQSLMFNRANGSFETVATDGAGTAAYQYSRGGLRLVRDGGVSDGVLSDSALYLTGNSGLQRVRVKMVEGKSFEDTTPGPFMGHNWQGRFAVQLLDSKGNTLSELDLNKDFQEDALTFNGTFIIKFEDLNNDGCPDFTIGQYGSSNGNVYRLYTIKDNKVESLPVSMGGIFSSEGRGRHTVDFEKYAVGNFINRYYDNTQGKTIEQIFTWDGSRFVLKPIK